MKKKYSLDYSIERDIDRVAAVENILDQLATDPTPLELEQMGSYILYGKDAEGLNAAQRGEIMTSNTRFSHYRRKEDKAVSLNAITENPLSDQQNLNPEIKRDIYNKPRPVINRPKYNRKTGELIDMGDADIPGMQELWDSIDRMDRWIAAIEGRIPPDETMELFDNSYRLYQLKHNLIDMRRQQYYLRDAYKPTLHFTKLIHPKAAFYDWTSDSKYWISRAEWDKKIASNYYNHISNNIEDYTTRIVNGEEQIEWMVRHHTFDWENPDHVRALISNYYLLNLELREKLDTYGNTLLLDFERYRSAANFTPARLLILDLKTQHYPYSFILKQLQVKYGLAYNENHLSTILSHEIPKRLAETALRIRLIAETPITKCKRCFTCRKWLPRAPQFFSNNANRTDGLSSNCKECERARRMEKKEALKNGIGD